MRGAVEVTSRGEPTLEGDLDPSHTPTVLGVQLVSSAVAVLLVFVVEGIGGIAVWNVVPVVLALGSIRIARGDLGSREVPVGALAFWASRVLSVTLLHAAWYFDWAAVATRSSTAGLIFLVVPVYTVAGGLVLAGLTILAVLGRKRWSHGGA
jgi:hypothetical protein